MHVKGYRRAYLRVALHLGVRGRRRSPEQCAERTTAYVKHQGHDEGAQGLLNEDSQGLEEGISERIDAIRPCCVALLHKMNEDPSLGIVWLPPAFGTHEAGIFPLPFVLTETKLRDFPNSRTRAMNLPLARSWCL